MLENKLEEIGFKINESKIYLKLLKIGPQPVSVISRSLGLNRTSTYMVLCELLKKGIVASFTKNKIKIFSANDPSALIAFLDSKSRTFDYYKSQFLSFMPQFRSLSEGYAAKRPTVAYYEGLDGVKQLLSEALTSSALICGYINPANWLSARCKDIPIQYEKILGKAKQKIKVIISEVPEARNYLSKNYSRIKNKIEYKAVKEGEMMPIFQQEVLIFQDLLVILNLEVGSDFGILIKDQQMSDAQSFFFDTLWEKLESYSKKGL